MQQGIFVMFDPFNGAAQFLLSCELSSLKPIHRSACVPYTVVCCKRREVMYFGRLPTEQPVSHLLMEGKKLTASVTGLIGRKILSCCQIWELAGEKMPPTNLAKGNVAHLRDLFSQSASEYLSGQ